MKHSTGKTYSISKLSGHAH